MASRAAGNGAAGSRRGGLKTHMLFGFVGEGMNRRDMASGGASQINRYCRI